MQDLRLVGVHDDGEHLVLADSEGNQFRVPLDDGLRDAARPQGTSVVTTARARTVFDDGTRAASGTAPRRAVEVDESMRPRDIQAMLRAGASVDEVVERSGWPHAKIERYAGPIQAERDHIAGMVRALPLRGRAGASDATFDERVSSRLTARGVDPDGVAWDSWKGEQGRWSVVCRFTAGGRERQATWLFDPTDRTISATDDEARWLGEDDQAGGPVGPVPTTSRRRDEPVYDVEAEGGLEAGPVRVSRRTGGTAAATQVPSEPVGPTGEGDADDPVDLVSAMRERAGRRRKGRRHGRSTAPAGPASRGDGPVDAQPQEHVDVDAAAAPPLGSHPAPEELSEPSAGEQPTDSDEPTDHDPVTGTAQLFPDDFGEPEEPARPARRKGKKKKARSRPKADDTAPDAPGEGEAEPADADPAGSASATKEAPEPAPQDEPEKTAREAEPADDEVTTPPQRPSASRRGRPAVPSWDDIMFGSKGTTH